MVSFGITFFFLFFSFVKLETSAKLKARKFVFSVRSKTETPDVRNIETDHQRYNQNLKSVVVPYCYADGTVNSVDINQTAI